MTYYERVIDWLLLEWTCAPRLEILAIVIAGFVVGVGVGASLGRWMLRRAVKRRCQLLNEYGRAVHGGNHSSTRQQEGRTTPIVAHSDVQEPIVKVVPQSHVTR